jgi:hypothetical protein
MKCMQLICVLVLGTWAVAVYADDSAGRTLPAPAPEAVLVPAPAYADFPPEAYPSGFSSYRGLGYMGVCCEQPSPAAALWKDFCTNRDHHAKLWDRWGGGQAGCRSSDGSQGWGSRCGGGCGSCGRVSGCGTYGCDLGCWGPGAGYWPPRSCCAARDCAKKCVSQGCARDRCAADRCTGCNGGGSAVAPPAAPLEPAPTVVPAVPTREPVEPAPSVIPPIPRATPKPVPPAPKAARYPLPGPNSPVGSFLRIRGPSPEDKSA